MPKLAEVAERRTHDVPYAAHVLGVPVQTLYDQIRKGNAPFPIIRVGTRILVPKAALDRLINGEGAA